MSTTTPIKRTRRTLTPRRPPSVEQQETASLHGTLSVASECLRASRLAERHGWVAHLSLLSVVAATGLMVTLGWAAAFLLLLAVCWWSFEMHRWAEAARTVSRLEAALRLRQGEAG